MSQCCAWHPINNSFPYHPPKVDEVRIRCKNSIIDGNLLCPDHVTHMEKIKDMGHSYVGIYIRYHKKI